MKKIILSSLALLLFSISIIIFEISCNKSANSQSQSSSTTPAQPKLQFYANGVLYNMDAVWDSRIGWINYPQFYKDYYAGSGGSGYYYSLQGSTYNNNTALVHPNNYINLGITNNSSIAVGTFNLSSPANIDCSFGTSPNLGVNYSSGNYSITITAVSGNEVTGTFSGTINTYPVTTPLNITQGTFSNLPIF